MPMRSGAALDDGKIDLAFGYLPQLRDTHHMALFEERYVLLLRAGHPLRRRMRTRASLESLDFVLVKSHSEPAKALHRLGLESRIRLTIPHFAVLPAILAQSDLAAIVPLRPAKRYASARQARRAHARPRTAAVHRGDPLGLARAPRSRASLAAGGGKQNPTSTLGGVS